MDRRSILTTGFYHLKSEANLTLDQEIMLWKMGIRSWDDLLDLQVEIAQKGIIPKYKLRKVIQGIKLSKEKRKEGNLNYFLARLNAWDFPRVFDAFEHFAYFGIKHFQDEIFTIVVFDGKQIHTYVQGVNLESFAEDVKKYDALACISGKGEEQQKSLAFNLGVDWSQTVFFDFSYQLHFKDNSDVYKQGNYSEYLKREKLSRAFYAPITSGFMQRKLTNWLWRAHKQGRCNALPTLLAINAQQVVHLSSVFMFLVNQQISRRSIPYQRYSQDQIEERKFKNLNLLQNYFHPDRELIMKIMFSSKFC